MEDAVLGAGDPAVTMSFFPHRVDASSTRALESNLHLVNGKKPTNQITTTKNINSPFHTQVALGICRQRKCLYKNGFCTCGNNFEPPLQVGDLKCKYNNLH